MPPQEMELPDHPGEALTRIREASHETPVLVFKKSPVCSISHYVEGELRKWLEARKENLWVSEIDVIARKPLARGLTAELELSHESPQALFFSGGQLTGHDSHHRLTQDRFQELASNT